MSRIVLFVSCMILYFVAPGSCRIGDRCGGWQRCDILTERCVNAQCTCKICFKESGNFCVRPGSGQCSESLDCSGLHKECRNCTCVCKSGYYRQEDNECRGKEDEDTGVTGGTIAMIVIIAVVVIAVTVVLYLKRGALGMLNIRGFRGVAARPVVVGTGVGYNPYGAPPYHAAGQPYPASVYPPQVNVQINQPPVYGGQQVAVVVR